MIANTQEQGVACSLPAPDLRSRMEHIRDDLASKITIVRELPDGMAFAIPESRDNLAHIQQFIEFERRCCGFAEFSTRAEPAQQRIWLEIRGPEGTKAFLRERLAETRDDSPGPSATPWPRPRPTGPGAR